MMCIKLPSKFFRCTVAKQVFRHNAQCLVVTHLVAVHANPNRTGRMKTKALRNYIAVCISLCTTLIVSKLRDN